MIDLHAHVVCPEIMGMAGELGPEMLAGGGCGSFRVGDYVLEGVDYRGTPFTDPALRLAAMDAAGITWQLLSPNPLTYFHHVDAPTAVAIARVANDAMAALVATAPGRFGGAAQLPAQDPAAAAGELHRAVGELGLLAGAMGTDIGAELTLDDPRLDVVWATAAELDVPVFLHPAPAGAGVPLRDPRLRRFDLDLWLNFAVEETLAVATLVFGGVLDRHPSLDVCISHGGGALVALIGKMRRASQVRPWSTEALAAPGAPEALLRRIWFDAHVSEPAVLDALGGLVGFDRLVGGTNFAGWDQPQQPADAPLRARLDLNAARLMRLDHGVPGQPLP